MRGIGRIFLICSRPLSTRVETPTRAMSPLFSSLRALSLKRERRLLTGESLRQCCCHCLIAVIKMSTMASGERGPALRCVPVCTHKKFTKGRSIFSRSIENGQSSPRPRLKCQPSYGNGQLGRRVGKQPVGNGQLLARNEGPVS